MISDECAFSEGLLGGPMFSSFGEYLGCIVNYILHSYTVYLKFVIKCILIDECVF